MNTYKRLGVMLLVMVLCFGFSARPVRADVFTETLQSLWDTLFSVHTETLELADDVRSLSLERWPMGPVHEITSTLAYIFSVPEQPLTFYFTVPIGLSDDVESESGGGDDLGGLGYFEDLGVFDSLSEPCAPGSMTFGWDSFNLVMDLHEALTGFAWVVADGYGQADHDWSVSAPYVRMLNLGDSSAWPNNFNSSDGNWWVCVNDDCVDAWESTVNGDWVPGDCGSRGSLYWNSSVSGAHDTVDVGDVIAFIYVGGYDSEDEFWYPGFLMGHSSTDGEYPYAPRRVRYHPGTYVPSAPVTGSVGLMDIPDVVVQIPTTAPYLVPLRAVATVSLWLILLGMAWSWVRRLLGVESGGADD